jgi:membrane protease subunit HflC
VKRVVFYALVAVVALAILLFMLSYTVRFTESAVITTFGSAGENAVVDDPGLKFKMPYPVQSVTTYDTRLRVLRTRSETQQTADDRQIVIETFCFWRVSDALAFFKAYSNAGDRPQDHYDKAEDILTDALRSAVSESSNYRLQELFTRDPSESKLAELEARILEALNSSTAAEEDEGGEQGIQATGIEVTTVGISRVVLPEATTQQVINRMKAGRERLAEEIRTEGESRATAIEAAADRDASLIESFALARAAAIRSEGIRESARFLAIQNESPELAMFLETLEFMKRDIGKKATLIQSVSDFGFQPFSSTFLSDLDENGVPRLRAPGSLMTDSEAGP